MTIAVTGATGNFGRLAVAELVKRAGASKVVALARDPAKSADLGVAVRIADYDKPETLSAALAGVERLILVSGSDVGARVAQHQSVIDAAKAAGVKLIAYTSLLHVENGPEPLATDHRATEEALRASGIPHVLLRNGWYMENYLGSVPGAVAGGAVIGASGDGKVSAATRADLAEAAAIVVTEEGHAGKVYELAGDEAFSMADLAAELSRQVGKEIPYRNLAVDEYAKTLEGFGLPAPVAAMIAGYDADVARGALFDDSRTLSRLLGRPTVTLAAGIASVLKATPAA